MPLTDTKIQAAKPADKTCHLSDEKGMYLEVTKAGGRYWRMKYPYLGKEKRLALGVYPETSLAQAQAKRNEAVPCWQKAPTRGRPARQPSRSKPKPPPTAFKPSPVNGTESRPPAAGPKAMPPKPCWGWKSTSPRR
ncbi:MAG: DUF4102 domain-containing protein [Alcanivorax sp.]|nr:DUF4102 domain-containing protein [Alcanivorax sp.]